VSDLIKRLSSGEVLVADGAMGTMLHKLGYGELAAPEEINLTHPEVLENIATDYLLAGAQIIQTNSFGGNPQKLAHAGLSDRVTEINREAAEAVRRVVENNAVVNGSIGPSGEILAPYGEADPEEIEAGFLVQARALIEGGVEMITVETMMDPVEACAAIRAVRSISSTTPLFATMTFDETPHGFYTIMGTSVEQAVEELLAAGADGVGSNCGNGTAAMVRLARLFRQCTEAPLLIQANAGMPEIINGSLVYSESPEIFAEYARQLLDAGVNIIGGCCGTTPEHIKAIRREVDIRQT